MRLVIVVMYSMAVYRGEMAHQFSNDGKYFAQITGEGKLKIWNCLSNTYEQQFTPDFHLTAQCTCLQFVSSDAASKMGSPRKKKRRDSLSTHTCIALGTSSGQLLIYSLTKGDLDYVIDSKTSQCVNCLSSNKDGYVFSGAENNVLVWNLHKRNINSKWATGNEKISAILAIPDSDKLLTASKNVKLWNIFSKEVLKSFTGHSSQVTLLHYISPKEHSADAYFISGSKGDRLLSCWNLNEDVDGKSVVASFLMEDNVNYVSVYSSHDGTTNLAATVRSGIIHIYQQTLNGKKSNKPLKPKTTIQIISDSQEDEVVSPMYITAAIYRDVETLCICYGSAVIQIFEDITISSNKKLQCLLRADVHKKNVTKENHVTKIRTPVIGNDVHYLTSQASQISTKRKSDGAQEVPMEKRLENLIVNEVDNNSKVPKAHNVAHLLIQGLHSKDKNILKSVLLKKDEQLIKNTVKRMPMSLIPALFEELTKLIQGKTFFRHVGIIWFRNLLVTHAGSLLSNPDLSNIFAEALGCIEAGMALQSSRNKLMGRLELLVSQISHVPRQESQDVEAAIVFNDKADTDNGDMEIELPSSSDSEWEESSIPDGHEAEKTDESCDDD